MQILGWGLLHAMKLESTWILDVFYFLLFFLKFEESVQKLMIKKKWMILMLFFNKLKNFLNIKDSNK